MSANCPRAHALHDGAPTYEEKYPGAQGVALPPPSQAWPSGNGAVFAQAERLALSAHATA